MKRYHVFAGDDYYPSGGGLDYRGSFWLWRSAHRFASDLVTGSDDWSNVLRGDKVIAEYERPKAAHRAFGMVASSMYYDVPFGGGGTWAAVPNAGEHRIPDAAA